MAKNILIIVLILALVAIGAYLLGSKYRIVPVTTPSPAPAIMATPGASPTAVPAANEEDTLIAAIKAALIAEHGSDAASLKISVSKIEGLYAEGMASSTGGGGMWFAAKVGGNWKLVWDGNGTIDCSVLTPYPNFPTDMIPECWNSATQTTAKR